ncbi:hypothetical protein ACTL6P_13270 [Endozoicomonas acroporae]|uniref:hypothetical protein n=1 Tax=Endozoicomonas acroporae TaxID=1701104 RepID=UPI000C76E12F|nr:hypothetical protein [Endozoicomonas acroporae]
MQASTSISSIIQMPQTQEASNLPDIPDQLSIQCTCMGRTVSLLERTAVNLAFSLPTACGVAISVGHPVTAVAGVYAGSFAGFFSAFVLGGAAGIVAENVYVHYWHVAPTESPVQLTEVISHDPEQVV